jgi:hypothetical protein
MSQKGQQQILRNKKNNGRPSSSNHTNGHSIQRFGALGKVGLLTMTMTGIKTITECTL